jgi:hypothetical protein
MKRISEWIKQHQVLVTFIVIRDRTWKKLPPNHPAVYGDPA